MARSLASHESPHAESRNLLSQRTTYSDSGVREPRVPLGNIGLAMNLSRDVEGDRDVPNLSQGAIPLPAIDVGKPEKRARGRGSDTRTVRSPPR
jgi:hypothetical protein